MSQVGLWDTCLAAPLLLELGILCVAASLYTYIIYILQLHGEVNMMCTVLYCTVQAWSPPTQLAHLFENPCSHNMYTSYIQHYGWISFGENIEKG